MCIIAYFACENKIAMESRRDYLVIQRMEYPPRLPS